jgi:glucosamine--fructose-6-phosphate aminotransferase (isomerizing)
MTLPKPIERGHWMLAEIFEQPESLRNTLALYVKEEAFIAEATSDAAQWLRSCDDEITFAASGSSRHAALVAKSIFAATTGIIAGVDFSSEYACRAHAEIKHLPLIVISQSGETADTLLALRRVIESGLPTIAVTNVPDSTMAREADVSFPTQAGIERAIPATKSFTAQLLVLELLALLAADARDYLGKNEVRLALSQLDMLPQIIEDHSDVWHKDAERIAESHRTTSSFLFLGRGIHYPIALEGALKMKESAYIPAEGYPSGELKHGPNALVTSGITLIMLATVDRTDPMSIQRYEKTLGLLRDMRQQGATIICIANLGDSAVAALADECIFVPQLPERHLIYAETICLQLLSYCFAVQAGIDVDNPRNLVKSVAVE